MSPGMLAVMAAVPTVPARTPAMIVGLGDLARRLPEAQLAELEARDGTGPAMIEFAASRASRSTPAASTTAAGWTAAMRAKAAEAQRRRGERQRAERAGQKPPPCPACAKLAPKQCDACYRRQLKARRKVEPRPTKATCEYCKEEFKISPRGWSKPRFCSRTCHRRFYDRAAKAARDAAFVATAPKACPQCGTPINQVIKPGRYAKYCSAHCRKQYDRAAARKIIAGDD